MWTQHLDAVLRAIYDGSTDIDAKYWPKMLKVLMPSSSTTCLIGILCEATSKGLGRLAWVLHCIWQTQPCKKPIVKEDLDDSRQEVVGRSHPGSHCLGRGRTKKEQRSSL